MKAVGFMLYLVAWKGGIVPQVPANYTYTMTLEQCEEASTITNKMLSDQNAFVTSVCAPTKFEVE